MQCFNRPSLATNITPRAVALAVASCLAAALMTASAASAAVPVSTAFDPLPVRGTAQHAGERQADE